MKMIILFLLIFTVPLFAQQMTWTWGETTNGVAYTQTGTGSLDSSSTTDIVFDMQDWYPLDLNPVASDDSVIILNSTRMNYGTFWYKIDLQNAADSSAVLITAYPGFIDYYPGTGERIATANIDYSTTATTLQDSSSYTTNDIQWTAVNVYISDTEGKIFPPEFLKINMSWGNATCDSITTYHTFVYPSVSESEQSKRTTTNSGNAKKDAKSLR
jgi:hypothetical protein